MTARERFNIGDRVRLSTVGLDLKASLRRRKGPQYSTGTVVGYGRSPEAVRVLGDEHKRPHTFGMEVWERIQEGAAQAHG